MTSSICDFRYRFLVLTFMGIALVSISWQQSQGAEIKANAVIGHKDFVTPDCNDPALPPSATLCHGVGVTVDPGSGKLFVADGDNNRVLIWPSARSFSNGERASVVLGKPDFTINQTLPCPTTAASLCDPNSVVVDHHGNLYVADTDGNRILRYSPPFRNGMKANLVIGEPDFITSVCTSAQNALCTPRDLAVDDDGNLIVVDSDNNRVLVFKAPLHNHENASVAIGQANFNDNGCNRNQSAPDSNTLCGPKGLARDPEGNLYVAEDDNARVLLFGDPLDSTGDMHAKRVFGQPNFQTTACNVGRTGVCAPDGVIVGLRGELIISDSDNNRLLIFNHPQSSSTADRVLGQPDFTSNAPSTTQSTFAAPKRIFIDTLGNLYVTDEDNNRVLRFNDED